MMVGKTEPWTGAKEGPVLRAIPLLLAALLLPPALSAQASLSPTLPSDTLQADYAPRTAPAPTPELAPTLPSDTLQATLPRDSSATGPFDDPDDGDSMPMTPADSAALRDLRSWIESHPNLISPPPVRAILVRV
jgi:hypothetical protein